MKLATRKQMESQCHSCHLQHPTGQPVSLGSARGDRSSVRHPPGLHGVNNPPPIPPTPPSSWAISPKSTAAAPAALAYLTFCEKGQWPRWTRAIQPSGGVAGSPESGMVTLGIGSHANESVGKKVVIGNSNPVRGAVVMWGPNEEGREG